MLERLAAVSDAAADSYHLAGLLTSSGFLHNVNSTTRMLG